MPIRSLLFSLIGSLPIIIQVILSCRLAAVSSLPSIWSSKYHHQLSISPITSSWLTVASLSLACHCHRYDHQIITTHLHHNHCNYLIMVVGACLLFLNIFGFPTIDMIIKSSSIILKVISPIIITNYLHQLPHHGWRLPLLNTWSRPQLEAAGLSLYIQSLKGLISNPRPHKNHYLQLGLITLHSIFEMFDFKSYPWLHKNHLIHHKCTSNWGCCLITLHPIFKENLMFRLFLEVGNSTMTPQILHPAPPLSVHIQA